MRTFYKYTRNFGADFFKKPTIRISNVSSLNDPFEGEVGDNLISIVNEMTTPLWHKSALSTKDIVNDYLKANGIFSVSETPRNLLMWAHYAEEHNGLCIGYSDEMFSELKKTKTKKYNSTSFNPQKINYDNYRFDREYKINTKTDLHTAIKNHLLTKSDDWIYEKEHRYIIPFSCATSFKIDKKNGGTTSRLNEDINIYDFINHGIRNGFFTMVRTNDDEEFFFSKEWATEYNMLHLSSFSCVVFLYEINPKYINSIHIGARVGPYTVFNLYKMINEKGSKIEHVKLYKYRLCTTRFELIQDAVDDMYIEKLNEIEPLIIFN